ncbi:MAG: MBL fold metallo-hydrolase [Acidimicrobiia bacterium]|nr:MBL fold metallo-hydrolase [Acidimicrobiia bacterium]
MADVLEMADAVWETGELPQQGLMLVGADSVVVEVAEGVGVLPSFCNVMPIRAGDALVLVDTSSPFTAAQNFARIREWTDLPLHTAVYTHGHVDHACGMGPFDAEARDRGLPRPRVVAHEAVLARFRRYAKTAGYNGSINRRQFGFSELEWPTEYREPDVTHRDGIDLSVGDRRLQLRHARGETDDHTWVFLPDEGVLYPGDLMIWCVPNAGNPQKVQRYAGEWAAALREMLACGAEIMLPSHGLPVVGKDRVATVLADTAELLESLEAQTLELMNAGASLDEVIHTVSAPAHLLERPWLQPIYDEPEFIVRNIWRLYGGWYDANPAHLHPAPQAVLAREVAALAGGAGALARRAVEVADAGDLRLAGHLVDFAQNADPADAAVAEAAADIWGRRRDAATSLMAKGIYNAAVRAGIDTARAAPQELD